VLPVAVEDRMEDRKKILPLLPLRDIVVFPHMVVPLFIGRDKSIAALDAALSQDRPRRMRRRTSRKRMTSSASGPSRTSSRS
jgi:ATP-dependent Lon protease